MKFNNRTGETAITTEGYEIEIIKYLGATNIFIKFKDGHETIKKASYSEFKKGCIKNPFHPSVCGVGFIGVGSYSRSVKRKATKPYNLWISFIHRAYDPKIQKIYPTYKDVTVCDEWHNYQNFAQWFKNNYIEGWHLDKDIICGECKIYSPETCAFVPREINNLLNKSKAHRGDYPIGVTTDGNKIVAKHGGKTLGRFPTVDLAFQAYKTAKEEYIKDVADKWKNLIDSRVYNTLIMYEVKIND